MKIFMIFFSLLIFVLADQASAQTVTVQSQYANASAPILGAGALVAYTDPSTKRLRKFVFTASHLSQGQQLLVKIDNKDAKVIGRHFNNDIDMEVLEIDPSITSKYHAAWDGKGFSTIIGEDMGSNYRLANGGQFRGLFFGLGSGIFGTRIPILILTANSQYFSTFNVGAVSVSRSNQSSDLLLPGSDPYAHSGLLSQIIVPMRILPGMSGSPLFLEKGDGQTQELVGIASQYDRISNRSYFISKEAMLAIFIGRLSGIEQTNLGSSNWIYINGQTVRRFNDGTIEMIQSRDIVGTASRGDSGTASRGDSGTASRGDSGTASRGDSGTASRGDSGTASRGDSGSGFLRGTDYSVMGKQIGMQVGNKPVIGFQFRVDGKAYKIEANLASYYWLKQRGITAEQLIKSDGLISHSEKAINLINVAVGTKLLLQQSGTSVYANDVHISRPNKQTLEVTIGGKRNQVDLNQSVHQVLYQFNSFGIVDIRSLFLLDMSEHPLTADITELTKTRKIYFKSSQHRLDTSYIVVGSP